MRIGTGTPRSHKHPRLTLPLNEALSLKFFISSPLLEKS
jgi:hypothetical protein